MGKQDHARHLPAAGIGALFPGRLRLPLIAAPMFRVSSPELVVAACRAGVIGAFPTANCRNMAELAEWLSRLRGELGPGQAPFAVNLIMRRETLAEELVMICRAGVELVITSVGSPAAAIPALHEAGCMVLADVASLAHARKALAAGADGLVLLSAGAGGQTGWANGMAFVRAVRQFHAGPVVLAGGISDGRALFAARAAGADLGYMGTRFIATHESRAAPDYKDMVVASTLDDILLTPAFTGLDASMLVPSILAAGLSPDNLPDDMSEDQAAAMYGAGGTGQARRWSDIWSAGHSVSGVDDVVSVQALVERLASEYREARAMLDHDPYAG